MQDRSNAYVRLDESSLEIDEGEGWTPAFRETSCVSPWGIATAGRRSIAGLVCYCWGYPASVKRPLRQPAIAGRSEVSSASTSTWSGRRDEVCCCRGETCGGVGVLKAITLGEHGPERQRVG
jgi:hypothetical protein